MKRSPLKRGAPIARTTRLRARRPTTRRSSRVHDKPYLADLHLIPCDLRDEGDCAGPLEASHLPEQGKRGLGMKCCDSRACCHWRKHHQEWEQRKGFFEGWSKQERGEYAELAIARAQAAVSMLRGGGLVPW
jgi:hypothetical protein